MRLNGWTTGSWILLSVVMGLSLTDSFQARWPCSRTCTPAENGYKMAKGFNKAQSKQAELAKKMELARKQKQHEDSTSDDKRSPDTRSDPRATAPMDRDREVFQRLLDSTKGAIPTDTDTEAAFISQIKAGQKKVKRKKKPPAPNDQQAKEDKDKKRRAAQRIHFESLIDVQTSKELGSIGAAKLVPWVPPYLNDCLIVFADPRTNSAELRQSIKYVASKCSYAEDDSAEGKAKKQSIVDQVVFITADSVPEIQAWLKRAKVISPIRIFSDPQLEWMSQYNLLAGEKGNEGGEAAFSWSLTLLSFDTSGDLTIQRRNVEAKHTMQLAMDTLKNMQS